MRVKNHSTVQQTFIWIIFFFYLKTFQLYWKKLLFLPTFACIYWKILFIHCIIFPPYFSFLIQYFRMNIRHTRQVQFISIKVLKQFSFQIWSMYIWIWRDTCVCESLTLCSNSGLIEWNLFSTYLNIQIKGLCMCTKKKKKVQSFRNLFSCWIFILLLFPFTSNITPQ